MNARPGIVALIGRVILDSLKPDDLRGRIIVYVARGVVVVVSSDSVVAEYMRGQTRLRTTAGDQRRGAPVAAVTESAVVAQVPGVAQQSSSFDRRRRR